MKVLHVIANPKPVAEAASKQVSEAFFAELKTISPAMDVETVDLYKDPPPFYSYEAYRHFWLPVFVPDYKPTAGEKKASEYALRHAKIFNSADALALTTPMWNFSVPAILKAWMDQILAPNVVFSMGAGGVKALHKVRQAVVFAASGGTYTDEDRRNNFTNEIRAAFGFVQIQNVDVAWADGQNGFFFKDSAERKEKAIRAARELARKVARL